LTALVYVLRQADIGQTF